MFLKKSASTLALGFGLLGWFEAESSEIGM